MCLITKCSNILFIFTDDQTYAAIHALGNEAIHTPHLDWLVRNGTTFTHAYNMGAWGGAVCVASRAMIISGRHIRQAREQTKKWQTGDSLALSQTWPQLMKTAGYDTYMTGKWHVAAPANKLFDEVKHIRPGMPPDAWAREKTWEKIKNLTSEDKATIDAALPPGYNRPIKGEPDPWSPADTSFGGFWEGGTHWSEVVKTDAEDFLRSAGKKDQPFFMYLAFNAPHDPRQAPQAFLDKYPLEEIILPSNWLPEYPWKDSIGCGRALRDEALAPFPRTEFALKTHLREYYAIISHLDEQIGGILEALKQSGEMENTFIFFTSDHGLAVGQHGLLGKQNMYDHSIRVPLVICGPDIPKDNSIHADVYLQDVMATSLELAGVEKPEHIQFNSLLNLARGSQKESHYPAIYGTYMNHQRMIRKEGFKLIAYPDVPKLRLYDLKNDPLEMNDLAEKEAYTEKVKTLFDELIQLQHQMEDTLNLAAVFNLTHAK
mgnify:CR=1 FL=1